MCFLSGVGNVTGIFYSLLTVMYIFLGIAGNSIF
jgi:hypothetical protein